MNTITVTVRRPGTSRWGSSNAPATHTVAGCVRWPRGSGEERNRSDVVTTGWMLSVPVGADIRATDQVQMPDDPAWWDVEGDPQPYESPYSGRQPGMPVALTRTKG